MEYNENEFQRQRQLQNEGHGCEYCGSPSGHYIVCPLLGGGAAAVALEHAEEIKTVIESATPLTMDDVPSLRNKLVSAKYNQPTIEELNDLKAMGIKWSGDERLL
jgi:hypothetical protein